MQGLQGYVVTTVDNSANLAFAEKAAVFPFLGAKQTNLQVRIFIHAIFELIHKVITGIFPALRSHWCLIFQVPWLRW